MTARKRVKLAGLWVARGLGLFALARRLTSQTVKILGYHYVSMEDEETRFPSLYLTPEELRGRLRHLQRHYQIVSLEEAVDALAEGRPGRGRVAITFDDGLYNFAGAAAPVLLEAGAPATVYVVSAHVQNEIPFCVMMLRDIFLTSDATELASPIPGFEDLSIATEADRAAAEAELTEHLDALPHATPERLAFTKAVGAAFGVDVDGLIEQRIWDVLSPEEMRQLTQQGFSVQVHGHNHINVVEQTDDVFAEVSMCAEILAGCTDQPAVHYCYPFGLWCKDAWPALTHAGIRSATTTLYGPNGPETPLLSLRRYMDGGNLSQLEFEFELSGLRWLLWSRRNPDQKWAPAEKLVTYAESGQLY